jgi:septal ring factor EnvC (AmiA/AmiB activator)
MTPAEHDKRQAESDAGMEQWEEGRAQRLRAFSEVMTEFPTIHRELLAAADHIDALRAKIERLRAEVGTLRRKSEAFDVIERERLTALAPSKYEPIPKWIVGSIFTHDSASGETLLSAVDAWLRRAKGGTP